jgi:hypothetical protein
MFVSCILLTVKSAPLHTPAWKKTGVCVRACVFFCLCAFFRCVCMQVFLLSFCPSFLSSFLPSTLLSFLPSFLPFFLISFYPSFLLPFLLSILPFFYPSFLPSFLSFLVCSPPPPLPPRPLFSGRQHNLRNRPLESGAIYTSQHALECRHRPGLYTQNTEPLSIAPPLSPLSASKGTKFFAGPSHRPSTSTLMGGNGYSVILPTPKLLLLLHSPYTLMIGWILKC